METTRFSHLRHRFRYTLKQLARFESTPEVVEQKSRISIILLLGFILYAVVTIYPCIKGGYMHGLVTGIITEW